MEDFKGFFEVGDYVSVAVDDDFARDYARLGEDLAADELSVGHDAGRHVEVEHRLFVGGREGDGYRVRSEVALGAAGRADAADGVGHRHSDESFFRHHFAPVSREAVVVGLADRRDADAGLFRLFDGLFNGVVRYAVADAGMSVKHERNGRLEHRRGRGGVQVKVAGAQMADVGHHRGDAVRMFVARVGFDEAFGDCRRLLVGVAEPHKHLFRDLVQILVLHKIIPLTHDTKVPLWLFCL